MAPYLLTLATLCFVASMLHSIAFASSGRVSMEQINPHRNQYFLNEFCDLESKTLRAAKKLKKDDTYSLFLVNKANENSARIQNQQKSSPRSPSSISFGFGSSPSSSSQQQYNSQSQLTHQPIKKQLNCSINVVAPKLYGLLVTINSVDLPANLTKLSVTLYQNSTHSQSILINGGAKQNSHFLLTSTDNSKIGISLQSFQPIDWSTLSFDILFTVYKKGNSTGCPNKKWYDCGENICVPTSLVCDGNRNCPNGNDEMVSYLCYSPLLLSIATSFILAIMLVVFIIIIILYVGRRRQKELQNADDKQNDDDDVVCCYDDEYTPRYLFGGVDATIDSSRIDLTLDTKNLNNGYLTNNLYASGFENPIWTSGALTKQQHAIHGTTAASKQNRRLTFKRH